MPPGIPKWRQKVADKISDVEKLEARKRFHIMMMVDSGTMTASDAAAELGMSRTAFYEWQNAATAAALDALTDGKPGRPKTSVEKHRIRELEKELALARRELEKARILSNLQCEVIAIRERQIAERQKKIN